MKRATMTAIALAGALAAACGEPPRGPTGIAPSFDRDGGSRTVVVSPDGRHDATTIQAGIDMVPTGGRIRVLPGTYPEALVINKGLTLEGVGRGHDDDDDDDGGSGSVIIAPPGAPAFAVQVTTASPVTVRGVTVQVPGTNGIRGDGIVDITVERSTVIAVNPPLGASVLVGLVNDVPTTGRARLVVRESFIDGVVPFTNSPTPPFPQSFAIMVRGDVDALIERNTVRRTGGACISAQTRSDLGGHMQADIIGNDVDECYPIGRAGAITTAPAAQNLPTATRPITATGVVNIVGNTIRNSFASCLPSTAILYVLYTGRIEHNRILGVVQPCAIATTRGAPAAILVGDQRDFFTAAGPVVRFNDIVGNAHAGLRVNRHQTTSLDARCNWWGSASGPSGVGPGTGDAIVVEPGAATPVFAPWATRPVAKRGHHGDHGDDDDDDDRHAGGRCRLD